MNPRTLFWQSLVTALLLVATIVLAGPAVALGMSAGGLLVALALNAEYAHALGTQGRTSRRAKGDALVASHVTIAFAVPLTLSAVAAVVGTDPAPRIYDFSHADVAAMMIAASGLFLVIFASSLVDWYYVRPRLDGVVRQPPCRASEEDEGLWLRVTRRWYLHRGVAALAYLVCAIVFAFVVTLMLARAHPVAASVVGGVSGLAGLFLIVFGSYKNELPTAAKWVLRPTFSIGQDLTWRRFNFSERGYVLHVSVPVVKFVPLDERGGRAAGKPFERSNSQLAESDLLPASTRLCDGACVSLNRECVRRITDLHDLTTAKQPRLVLWQRDSRVQKTDTDSAAGRDDEPPSAAG